MAGKKNHSGDNQPTREHAAALAARVEARSSRLLPVTVPIYRTDLETSVELLGTAVLVQLAEIPFLVTAGHVLDLRADGPLAAGVSPDILPIIGDVTRLRAIGSKSSSDDHVDLGIVRLAGQAWKDAPTESFARWTELDHQIPILARHTYSLVGFPVTVNRRGVTKGRATAVAYRMAGLECDAVSYEATGTNPETNVMVGFDRKAVWGVDGRRNSPDLYGASGSGLWRYGRRISDSSAPPKLSAIAIEWHKGGVHKHILGTRITAFLGAMHDKYEDVREYIDRHSA
jgi:hypothetical protein